MDAVKSLSRTKRTVLDWTPAEIRAATPKDIPELARLWHDGWHDAHAAILPESIAQTRTFEKFLDLAVDAVTHIRVAGPHGWPLGFHVLKNNEINQFYVSAKARGTGVAAALLADAEARLVANGARIAWLACAIGNDRAARFYEKNGWHRARTVAVRFNTIGGALDVKVWRYEKPLIPSTGG